MRGIVAGNESDVEVEAIDNASAPPAEIIEALKAAGEDPSDPRIMLVARIAYTRAAEHPFPSPQALRQGEALWPGYAATVMRWTEEEIAHRRHLELADERRLDRGQFISAAIALAGLLSAAIVAVYGNPWAAGIMAIVSVGGPTAATILARTLARRRDD